MSDFFSFAPNPERAARLDARMHTGLAESLEHISEQCGELSGFDHDSVLAVARALRAGARVSPIAFGRYYELAFPLVSGAFDDAIEASRRFADLAPFDGDMRINRLGDDVLAQDSAMIRRRIGLNAEERYLDPTSEMAEAFEGCLRAGLDFIDGALPSLAGEIRAILRQVILATGRSEGEDAFDGASAYQLWGAVVLNARSPKTPVEIAETLAHEGAHSLLFGFTYDEPLVLNEDGELFHSPLREDPRPMDGVYHATFVCARMHWAMAELSQNSDLDAATRAEAERSAPRHIEAFYDGMQVVEEHARLSDTGRSLIKAAKTYMKTVS